MDFFGFGFGEIVLILVLALILFGPAKIPEVARAIGKYTRALRKMSSDFTQAVSKEIELDENAHKIDSDVKVSAPRLDISLEDDGVASNHVKAEQPQDVFSPQVSANTNAGVSTGSRVGKSGS